MCGIGCHLTPSPSLGTKQTWDLYPPGPHGHSRRPPIPFLGPLLTSSPSQSRPENSPTVAARPGAKWSSQNLLRKDVFPTAELPTNTILKSRSGMEGQTSSCGRQTVWPTAGMITSPSSCCDLSLQCLGQGENVPPDQHEEGRFSLGCM